LEVEVELAGGRKIYFVGDSRSLLDITAANVGAATVQPHFFYLL
jgi:hypothetical protein